MPPTLEEIVFQAGRDALADQDAVVTGIRQEAADEADAGTLGWLVAAAYGYQLLRGENAGRVRNMGRLLTALGALMVLQTLCWLIALR